MPDENVAQGDTNATTEVETTETTEQTTETTTETAEAPQLDAGAFVLPEGFSGLDEAAVAEFMPLAKELGMNQEQAQKAITLHANTIKAMADNFASQRAEAFQAGVEEIKAAYGPKYDENMGLVESLIGEYGGDKAIEQARSSVYGNKSLTDTLLKIAQAAGPHRFINGKNNMSDLPTKTVLFAESLKD
jgi:hypothetical protein